MDLGCKSYMEDMAKMERCWQTAVDHAISARENQLVTAHRTIVALRLKVSEQEYVIRQREQEMKDLQNTVSDLTTKFESVLQEKMTSLADAERRLQEIDEERSRQLCLKEKEIEDMRSRQYDTTKALTAEARHIVQDLEDQLDVVKSNETKHLQKIAEIEQEKEKYEMCLNDWDRVCEKMGVTVLDLRSKLNSSRCTNSKFKEQMLLMKKYIKRLKDEIMSIQRETDHERNVIIKLNEIGSKFESKGHCTDMIVDAMNKLGCNIIEEIKGLEVLQTSYKVVLVSVESQTDDTISRGNEKTTEIELQRLRKSALRLEDGLKKAVLDIDSLIQQNMTLKEVIKSMRKERELWKNGKEQMEEEIRVVKLEEIVKLLKNSLLTNQKDSGVLTALQDVKKQVSDLINQNMHSAQVQENTHEQQQLLS